MIRLATEQDGAALHAIYAPIVASTAISFELEPPSIAEMAARVARITQRHPWLVDDADGIIRGYAYATAHRERQAYQWSVDVSVYVADHARGGGVGRALYGALFQVLRAQGFANAYAGIALPNEPSVGLHRALGFAPIGVYRRAGYKLGAWHDVEWWARDIGPYAGAPAPPRPVSEVVGEVLR
jgi:L-amino acid N-acyltransferase YncA